MRCAVWLLVVATGCRIGFDNRTSDARGDDAAIDDAVQGAFVPYWTSGTRLRARLLTPVEGGDPYFYGWHDTALDMDCTSGLAADGAERCVHLEHPLGAYFSDAGCTTSVTWIRPHTCGDGHYVSYTDTSTHTRVFPVGALYTGPLYSNVGGCMPVAPPSGGELHVLGAELAASQLAAVVYRSVPIGSSSRPVQGSADGSGVELKTLTTVAGGCFPSSSQIGPSPCIANAARATEVYLDTTCTQRAYYWDRFSYDLPTTTQLSVFDVTPCSRDYRLFNVTADLTQATYYKQTPTTGCQGYTTGPIAKIYAATEIPKELPVGQTVVGPRRGRLGYLYWVGPDNIPLVTRYWDHLLQMPCVPINGTDGKLRCLPEATRPLTVYDNATCLGATQPLAPACFPSVPVKGPDYTSCVDSYTVRSLPSAGTSASVFGDTCSPLSLASGFYDVSSPGAEIDPTMFAELFEVIE